MKTFKVAGMPHQVLAQFTIESYKLCMKDKNCKTKTDLLKYTSFHIDNMIEAYSSKLKELEDQFKPDYNLNQFGTTSQFKPTSYGNR